MRLKDWNESLLIANEIAEKFKAENVDVRVTPYSMYDEKRGIHLQLFDANGNFFREVSSGIHEDSREMKSALISAGRQLEEYI